MMFASTKVLLKKAQKGRYALGAFNVNNMEILQAVVLAAEGLRSPVIVSVSEGALQYAGFEYLLAMTQVAARTACVPLVLHLDHGRSFEIIRRCVDAGFSSVMFDGSQLSFDENVRFTKKVVILAHKKGVSVEGELGTIGGAEDKVSSRSIIKTNPLMAKEFVRLTGVDFLAIALGTSHGAHKFSLSQKVDLKLLAQIREQVTVPFVLHGASEVPKSLVARANKYGATIEEARGVSDKQIRDAVRAGICKVNDDTDLRLAFTAGIRETLVKEPNIFDPRKILTPGKEAMIRVVTDRLLLLGCKGKA